MPRRHRNERNPFARNHNIGERESSRLTADNLARHNAAMSEAQLHEKAEEKFARHRTNIEPPRERLTAEKLAWKAWNNSVTTVPEEERPAPLTADNLSRHDAETDEADRPVLSTADLARRNATVNEEADPQGNAGDDAYKDIFHQR
ncbi:hypothetical protein PMIN07_005308 [Paraphaeosphaeria minitans]